ncbi:MAG: ubiquinone biosynthesis protein COQ4 [Flavobacteriaceae bacterium]|nr:ubiquinone biosynthesis protein COQ4 [Flavobacteriaceae bacterium]
MSTKTTSHFFYLSTLYFKVLSLSTIRKRLIVWLFDHSQKIYTQLFKNHKSWGLSKKDLLLYPSKSLGKHLGEFLDKYGFELIPKVERHDAYHTLTGFGINVEDEIALQYLCFGNGKRSLYLYGAILLGTCILPDYLPYYLKSFRKGRKAYSFHQYDYRTLLHIPIKDLRNMFLIHPNS